MTVDEDDGLARRGPSRLARAPAHAVDDRVALAGARRRDDAAPSSSDRDYSPIDSARADLEAHARVRRHALQRLAVAEEHRQDRAGRPAARGAGAPRARTPRAAAPGRTDAGVHALAQVAHLKARKELAPADLAGRPQRPAPLRRQRALGRARAAALPRAPRRRSRGRTSTGSRAGGPPSTSASSGGSRTAWTSPRCGARPSSSRAATTSPRSARTRRARSRRSSSSRRARSSTRPHEIHFRITASHFLWKMVRRLAGTLVEVGRGNLDAAGVEKLLREKSTAPAKWTAPPSGLFLEKVTYP